MTVYVLVEEIDSGSFADGNPYCVHAVHRTHKGARTKVAAYNKQHGRLNEDGWTKEGTCLRIESFRLED